MAKKKEQKTIELEGYLASFDISNNMDVVGTFDGKCSSIMNPLQARAQIDMTANEAKKLQDFLFECKNLGKVKVVLEGE